MFPFPLRLLARRKPARWSTQWQSLIQCHDSPGSLFHGDRQYHCGQVTGLLGSGLVLQNNGVDNLPVIANGGFNFATTIANGAMYKVTVQSQPTNPSQTCTVANGSGTASGNVAQLL